MYTITKKDGSTQITDNLKICYVAAIRDGAQVVETVSGKGVYFAA